MADISTDAASARHRAAEGPQKRRRGRKAEPEAPARRGRRISPEQLHALRADAVAASEILAKHSAFWGPDEIFAHIEIASIVITETRDALAAAPRSERKQATEDLELAEQALEALRAAHDAGAIKVEL